MKTVTSFNSKWYSERNYDPHISLTGQDRPPPPPLPLPKYRTPRLHFYFYKFFKGLKVLHKITKNKHFWIKIRIIIIYRERIYIWGGGDSEGGGSVLTSMHLAVISLGLCLCRVTYIHIIARPRLSLTNYHVIHKKRQAATHHQLSSQNILRLTQFIKGLKVSKENNLMLLIFIW